MSETVLAQVGHNQPPSSFDVLKESAGRLIQSAADWLKADVSSDETAGLLDDFINVVKASYREVEKERKVLKQPHTDAAKAVDAQFKPLSAILDTTHGSLKKKLVVYMEEKREREAKEAHLAAVQAQHLEDAAQEATEEAESTVSVDALIDAADAEKRADDARKQAKHLATAPTRVRGQDALRSRSFRKVWTAELTNLDEALAYYCERDEVSVLLTKLACADARSGQRDIPGFRVFAQESLT